MSPEGFAALIELDTSGRDLSLGPPEDPEMSSQYFPENETVSLTIENGNLTHMSDVVAVTNKTRISLKRNNDTIPRAFTISYRGNREKTRFWATRSFYGLGLGIKALLISLSKKEMRYMLCLTAQIRTKMD